MDSAQASATTGPVEVSGHGSASQDTGDADTTLSSPLEVEDGASGLEPSSFDSTGTAHQANTTDWSSGEVPGVDDEFIHVYTTASQSGDSAVGLTQAGPYATVSYESLERTTLGASAVSDTPGGPQPTGLSEVTPTDGSQHFVLSNSTGSARSTNSTLPDEASVTSDVIQVVTSGADDPVLQTSTVTGSASDSASVTGVDGNSAPVTDVEVDPGSAAGVTTGHPGDGALTTQSDAVADISASPATSAVHPAVVTAAANDTTVMDTDAHTTLVPPGTSSVDPFEGVTSESLSNVTAAAQTDSAGDGEFNITMTTAALADTDVTVVSVMPTESSETSSSASPQVNITYTTLSTEGSVTRPEHILTDPPQTYTSSVDRTPPHHITTSLPSPTQGGGGLPVELTSHGEVDVTRGGATSSPAVTGGGASVLILGVAVGVGVLLVVALLVLVLVLKRRCDRKPAQKYRRDEENVQDYQVDIPTRAFADDVTHTNGTIKNPVLAQYDNPTYDELIRSRPSGKTNYFQEGLRVEDENDNERVYDEPEVVMRTWGKGKIPNADLQPNKSRLSMGPVYLHDDNASTQKIYDTLYTTHNTFKSSKA